MSPLIEVSIRYGSFGEKFHSVAVQVPEDIIHALTEPFEYDPQPLHGSPAGRKGATFVASKRIFKLRNEQSKRLGRQLEKAIWKVFGADDTLHGYKIADMAEEEIKYHKERGRL